MALPKKISQLPPNTNPSLSGSTALVDGGVTYQVSLSTIKETISGTTEAGSSGTSGTSGVLSLTGNTEGDMLYWNDTTKEWSIPISGMSWNDELTQINLNGIQFNTTYAPGTHQEGLTHWDDDAGTLQLGLKGGTVKLQVGLEQVLRAKNTSGQEIPNGTPVYISGASGGKPTIAIANATNHIVANSTLAITTETISNNNFGYSTTQGCVNELDTSSFIEGRPVFLGAISGLTQTLPTAPISKVFVGVVISSHGTEGRIFVKIVGRPNLDELSNVDIATGVTAGEIIVYDGSKWINTGNTSQYVEFINVDSPSNGENIPMFFTFVPITITEIQGVVSGLTPSVTINPTHSTDRGAAGNNILTSATAITNTTTGQNLTTFTDATIPADSWVILRTTALSGTVDQLSVAIKYTED